MTDKVRILFDAHAHLYPQYDLQRAFARAEENFRAHGNSAVRLLCLTERYDCHFFHRFWQAGTSSVGRYRVTQCANDNALEVCAADGEPMFLIPGRQIITAERLEVLALGMDLNIGDGGPIRTVLEAVRKEGAICVIPWSPGKWLFSRGERILELAISSGPEEFFFGDSTLRPRGWPPSSLIRLGRRQNLRLLYGSDPLPFKGEERWLGRYVTETYGSFDPTMPTRSLLTLLANTSVQYVRCGARAYPGRVFYRLIRNRLARRHIR